MFCLLHNNIFLAVPVPVTINIELGVHLISPTTESELFLLIGWRVFKPKINCYNKKFSLKIAFPAQLGSACTCITTVGLLQLVHHPNLGLLLVQLLLCASAQHLPRGTAHTIGQAPGLQSIDIIAQAAGRRQRWRRLAGWISSKTGGQAASVNGREVHRLCLEPGQLNNPVKNTDKMLG